MGEIPFRLEYMEEKDAKPAALLEAECSREPWTREAYLEALQNENALYVTAKKEGRLIGCSGIWQSFETGDICNVAVAPDCRRQGVAEEMLGYLMEQARKRGMEQFTLEVRSANTPAIRLYEKLGFVTEGVRRGFYDAPKDDALIMWKR